MIKTMGLKITSDMKPEPKPWIEIELWRFFQINFHDPLNGYVGEVILTEEQAREIANYMTKNDGNKLRNSNR